MYCNEEVHAHVERSHFVSFEIHCHSGGRHAPWLPMVLRQQKDGLLVVASVLCDFVMKHSPASYREAVVGTSCQARNSPSRPTSNIAFISSRSRCPEKGARK